MIRQRKVGFLVVLAAALVGWAGPAVRAETEEAALGMKVAAGEILRSGYDLEREMVDPETVVVRVLSHGEVLASARGRLAGRCAKPSTEPERLVDSRAEVVAVNTP